MIYKTLKKVSNVCQLLDKSKYPSVITNSGVTTTSNGDGSITINGTATKSNYINCTPNYPKENNGHVFYVCANNTTMSSSTWYYALLNQAVQDKGSGVIAKTDTSRERFTGIVFNKGIVFDNAIIKPQIIDLTEMYGAGNEPTTVEEFREKFPNELYDYKPYCFVKSYKNCLTCTTKNLFDISKVFSAPTLCFDVSSLEIGQTYTFSSNKPIRLFKISTIRGGYNSVIYSSLNGFTTFTFVMARDANIPVTAKQYLFLWLLELTTGSINDTGYVTDISQLNGYNLQIELGDTATEYQPYGYIQSRKKSLVCTTKNLFDKSFFSPLYDIAYADLIDVKENGWIVQGKFSNTPGTGLYNNGWFRPGYILYNSNIGILLHKAGKVTVSAYYTVLENNSISTANIYLYGTRQKVANYPGRLPDVGIKTRRYITYDINEGEEGLYYPVFTLNSSKILIEDIQVEYGDTPTEYHPYGHL